MKTALICLTVFMLFGTWQLQSQVSPQIDYSKLLGSFHPNENTLALTDGNWVGITDINFQVLRSNMIHNIPTYIGSRLIRWSPDGDKIAITLSRDIAPTEVTQIWRVNPLEKIFEVAHTSLTGIAWSPDSTKFATLVRDIIQEVSIAIYDANTGALLKEIDIDYDSSFILWSRNDNRLIVETPDELTIYNADTGLLIDSVDVSINSEAFLRISPFDNTIAFVDLDTNLNTIQLLNIDTDLRSQLIGHQGRVYLARWTKGGLVTFGADKSLIKWDIAQNTGRKFQFVGDFGGELNFDGGYLINNNREIGANIRNSLTGEVVAIFNPTFNEPTPTPPVVSTLQWQTTSTLIPPTATFTPTNTPIPPTATFTPTNTPIPPTATFTPTETPIPPTATFTPTPIPPSPTPTATSVACTHTVTASSTSSLISAIVSANSASTPSTICLGGGTYTLTAVNNSDESPSGLPSITKNITIIGNNSVIERATSAPQFRIFRVASNGRLSLNNLTVRGGHAGSLSGGGVRNLGILELNTVIVENNTGNAGGGIRNNNNATFTAINSLIRNNISTTNGGGLYANNSSSTTLTNTNFLGNTVNASNGLGGAIFSNGNIFTMNGGIIQNNSSRNGGGIFVNITTQAMSLNGVQFTGNTASNHGAGIYHLSGTTFSVQNGRFTSNIATNEGGAIAGDGTFTISNSNFLSNSANIGGAIHAQATSGSSIQQSCLENNTAPNTIGIFNEATILLNAQNNFWGSASASGSVSANVNTNGALMACGNP